MFKIIEIQDALKINRGNLTIESFDSSIPLPPASLQGFLKKDLGIPGVVISNHRKAFTNQFYNSEWDNFNSINSKQLSKQLGGIAYTVAAAVYQLSTGKFIPANVKPNMTLVCFLVK